MDRNVPVTSFPMFLRELPALKVADEIFMCLISLLRGGVLSSMLSHYASGI
ncbi:MAG: hypothetical protein ACYCSO_06400 [Cuniculiplasma sp.]